MFYYYYTDACHSSCNLLVNIIPVYHGGASLLSVNAVATNIHSNLDV